MNKPTKPISSPGRTDKFPPPLMRFLRSNVGSKSRRRSRASPMFVRKKNTVIETTQEPSSPKVTCIGQVRVRRSSKTTAATSLRQHHHRNRICRCLRTLKPRSFRSGWNKWVSFFRCGSCKNNSQDVHSSPVIKHQQERDVERADNISEDLISRSPPKNVLLLTRCRSAPYRSSSLASIFMESTMERSGEEEEVAGNVKSLKIEKEEVIKVENGGVSEVGTCIESNGGEELKAVKALPLILTRCKSESARTWDQLLV